MQTLDVKLILCNPTLKEFGTTMKMTAANAVLVILITTSQASADSSLCPSHLELGNPGGADITLCHDGYALGYSYEHKIPIWCAYWIERETLDINVDRQDDFRGHPDVNAQYGAGDSDYRGSGFDRGHCAPSGSIDYNVDANSETFFYSNMFPQLPGFNRNMFGHKGVWGFLEGEVRSWTRKHGRMYVISGSYVPTEHQSIGEGVAVPTHFYKIVVNPSGPEVIAFWMPHRENTRYDAASYLSSVDEIEEITGLDFMSLLIDDQENDLERRIESSLWD